MQLAEFSQYLGAKRCDVLFGKVSAGTIVLGKDTSNVSLFVPASPARAVVPVSLQCKGVAEAVDLGSYLEYVGVSVATAGGDSPCPPSIPRPRNVNMQ